MPRLPVTNTFRYTVLGVVFGLCFPLLGTALCAWTEYGSLAPWAWRRAQLERPLLWIIDTAPFFLGLFAGLAGVRQDRVERLYATLQRVHREQQAVHDAMADLLFVIDTEGRLVRFNRRFERVTGRPPEWLHGRSVGELVPPEDRVLLRERLAEALARGIPRLEVRLLTPDGPVRYEWNGRPLHDEHGRLVGIAGTGRDVEVQRRLQEALERSERAHRVLFEHARDAILVTDPETETVLQANPAADALYGVARGALVGRSLREFRVADGAPSGATDRNPEEQDVEIVHRRADGTLMHLEARAARVSFEGRSALLCVYRDVTERVRQQAALRAAKERAEASDRLKAAILQNMGHELRTPLTEIIGWAQVIAEEADGPAREFAGYVEGSARRLMRTLDALFELAHLEARAHGLARAPVPLAPLLREAVGAVRPAAEAKGLRLDVKAPADAVAWADGAALRRALAEVLDNAVRFTARGGVRVHAARQGTRVRLAIADTGRGMSEAFLPRAFEAFTQEASGPDRSHEGLGLGLAVARGLVEAMGGSVGARSSPGAGTEVVLVLPAHTGPA